MIARTLAATALAGAAVLVPTAAFAETYPAPADSLTCSAAQVAPGSTFSCVFGGPNGAEAQLQATTSGDNATIAGTVTSEVKTIADNTASFTVTAPATAGTIGVTAIIDGAAADTAAVAVVSGTGTASGSDEELSSTGFENAGLAAGAGALLVAGAATVYVAARRRSAQNV